MIPFMFYNKAIVYFEQAQKPELLERAKQKMAILLLLVLFRLTKYNLTGIDDSEALTTQN